MASKIERQNRHNEVGKLHHRHTFPKFEILIFSPSPKRKSSSLVNKMIYVLAEYQIQSNDSLRSDVEDDNMLKNIFEFWLEFISLPL